MKEIFRRDFLKLGVGGFTGLAISDGLGSAFPLDISSMLASKPLRFDFLLSVMARESLSEHDLGGTIQAGISAEDRKILTWNREIPSSLLESYHPSFERSTSSRFDLQTKLGPAGSELKLDKLIIQPQNSNNVLSISLDEKVKIGDLPKVFSFERTAGGVSYDFLGAIGQSRIETELTLLTPIQFRRGPLFFDSGWRRLPFGYQFRIKGPEAHPLRPCRSRDTWHYNVEIKRNGRWVANHHYGAYKENRSVCLLYYESRRGTCRKSCTPRVPRYSEVYNFTHNAVDNGFRKLNVALPYVAVAVIAYILASLFFSGLVVAI